jgi:hypothetical protein
MQSVVRKNIKIEVRKESERGLDRSVHEKRTYNQKREDSRDFEGISSPLYTWPQRGTGEIGSEIRET